MEFLAADVSLGTTIIAVTYKDGVILGADTRTSTGNYVANRATDKITPLLENIYMCRSGSAADTQAIASYVQYFLAQHQAETERQVDVKTAATLIMQMAYGNKNMLSAGMIVAGYDKYDGGSVYGVPLGGTLLKLPFATGGSGSAYIYGFCDKYFKPDMSEEEANQFVKKAVCYAMARDASSGGCVRMVTINASGAHREFIPGSELPITW